MRLGMTDLSHQAALTHLLHKVLDDGVFHHLGADWESSPQLLLNPGQHLPVVLCCEPFSSCRHTRGIIIIM